MKLIFKLVLNILGTWGLLKYIILGILSGMCSFLFINTVTKVIGLIMAGELVDISREYLIIFSLIILSFIWIRMSLSLFIIRMSQMIFWNLRKQIISLVLRSGYQQLSTRKAKVHAAIVNDVNILTQASMSIIEFFTAFILAVACLIYLGFISVKLLFITMFIAFLGVVVYHLRSKKDISSFHKARSLEDQFLENFNGLLNGFKEIYLDPRRGQSIFNGKIIPIANEAYDNNISAFTGYLNNQITGQVLFYLLISSVLLILSVKLNIKPSDTVSFVFTLLYLLSSIETIMVLFPGLIRAMVASNVIMDLKEELEENISDDELTTVILTHRKFVLLEINDLEYYYKYAGEGFGIGPVNLTVERGQIIFIYGGNGTGKTTFVHCLLGLIIPVSGEIRYNNQIINKENYTDYRSFFAVVFSDFHLFSELFLIPELDLNKWKYYLKLFEMEDKVELSGYTFSTTELSTGQRKRLALISALLEEKPILVIDEWAADQDPYFRRKFYEEIIPEIVKNGTAVIAVTHDDKYYHCADKLFKMEEGKLHEEDLNLYKVINHDK